MRALYVDLDGTLLGPDGTLLRAGDKSFSLAGVRALEACHRAGVEVVLMSGRRKVTVAENARLFGQSAYIYEAGSCLVLDGEEIWLTGELMPDERGSIHDQIEASGAPAMLLETYAGRLEYHDPWHHGREVSHLFRGLVDAREVDALLEAQGHGALRLVDNGGVHRRSPALVGLADVRAYHLVPRGASKAAAVARHMRARMIAPEEAIAVGDSREDLETSPHVGAFWFVGNAVARDPTLREAIAGRANVHVAEETHGAGVYEAVVTTLATRGG
ncbi:MAG TPA: HAD hydrolase family protein [Solirubrobacteraceae bacterium]|nr:HAD hydrolase family protein [Solirubrobacteraceae bacterium]